MGRLLLLAPLVLLLAAMSSQPAFADKRVALVVGNSDYRVVNRLDNPANDARLLADTLAGLGFTIVGGGAQLDLDKAAFARAVQDFGSQLIGADVGLFYYAGHGIQIRDTNYLVPVDANPTKEADVDFQMLDAKLVLRQMEGAGTRLNIVILDACRTDPFSGRALQIGQAGINRVRDIGSGGLARMDAPAGTLISFATQPGNVAQDGSDGHSPYARALAETIRKPGLGLFDAFNEVGVEVKRTTGGAQLPWVSNSPIEGTFYFAPASGAAPVATGPAADEVAWERLRDKIDVASLGRFMHDFPGSAHAGEAATLMAKLDQATVAANGTSAATPTLVSEEPLKAEAERALKSNDTFKECETCPVMVTVPPGSFAMGSPSNEKQRQPYEGPQQKIEIPKVFAVGRTAVSFDEWNACIADGGCNHYRPGDFGFGTGKHPVIFVSWKDAKAYVDWLSKKTGEPYRLLSEAEREYVARACTTASCPSSPFWFGLGADISHDRANYDSRFSYDGSAKAQPRLRTVETDAAEPNPFGLLHVLGNVREWVEDCWNPTLAAQPAHGEPRTTGDCMDHVVRGGSWADRPEDLRSAKRSWETADHRDEKIGFRVARTLRN